MATSSAAGSYFLSLVACFCFLLEPLGSNVDAHLVCSPCLQDMVPHVLLDVTDFWTGYGYILQLEGFANLDVQNIFRAQQNLPQSSSTRIWLVRRSKP